MTDVDRVKVGPLESRHVPACEAIAHELRSWFGLDEGLREMRAALRSDLGFIGVMGEQVVGFVTAKPGFPETWEITWLAVTPARHRQGVGHRLVEAVGDRARQTGARVLLVKTLADPHPSPEYAQTRAFYIAIGFLRLAVVPEVWGPANPCLFLARPLSRPATPHDDCNPRERSWLSGA